MWHSGQMLRRSSVRILFLNHPLNDISLMSASLEFFSICCHLQTDIAVVRLEIRRPKTCEFVFSFLFLSPKLRVICRVPPVLPAACTRLSSFLATFLPWC